MPVTNYQYLVTDTANDKVYIPQLAYEIGSDVAIGVQVDVAKGINVNVEPGKLDVCMADLLTAPQEAALDAGGGFQILFNQEAAFFNKPFAGFSFRDIVNNNDHHIFLVKGYVFN